METSLLATKLRIPPQPRHVVRRARLLDLLEDGILHYKLVLISAPAGYGKTTLISQWAQMSPFPVAWLSLSQRDNDIERFLRYLLRGWEEAQPGVGESALGLLLGSLAPDNEAVLAAFINAANEAPGHMLFVLDDYHLIKDDAVQQAMGFLLEHLPPTLHFVLGSRGEPSLPLARYRARQEMLEIGTQELGLTLEESTDYLIGMKRIELAHSEIVKLHDRLEGWIAGLQLVALTVRDHGERVGKLILSGRHRHIADYLSEDVISQLPDETERFLLQTSILDRLCGSSCNAVTETEGGQEMLESLERESLFLMPLDDSREWFRYHRIFADYLYEELCRRYADEVAGLHRRAARWYLAHDLSEQAFRHAAAGEDAALVAQVIERYLSAKLLGGELKTVIEWLADLPEQWHSEHPIIGIAQAGIFLFSGQIEACIHRLDEIERQLPRLRADSPWQQGKVTAIRCGIACFQNDLARAEDLADEALKDLSEEDINFRPVIYGALGDTYRRNGRWQEAKACYLRLLGFTEAPALRVQSAHVYGALADLDLRQGRLRDAAAYWRKALEATRMRENWGRLPLPVIGWVYLRMGELLYEWNDLSEAWDHLGRGLERAELGGDVRAMVAGYLLAGRMKLTEGDSAAAMAYLERARPLLERAQFPYWLSRLERLQLEIWVAQDRHGMAVNWVNETLDSGAFEGRPESEIAHLAMARVLMVESDGSAIQRAVTLLNRMLVEAVEEGRVGIQIEALALQALAQWRRGDGAAAMPNLEQALRMAEPEGYARLFADMGLPMARMLQEARARAVQPEYVTELLGAFSGDLSETVEGTLPEPLSPREQEVLKLMAAGLTNREIGERLVISPQTVKKHSGNIYGKLGVRSRTEAAARARELDLLD